MKKILFSLTILFGIPNFSQAFFPLKLAELLRARGTRNIPATPIFNSDTEFNHYMDNLEQQVNSNQKKLKQNNRRLQFNKYLRSATLFIINLFKNRR